MSRCVLARHEDKPADRRYSMQNQEPIGVAIMSLPMRVLRIELLLQERELLRVGPCHHRQFFPPRRRIDAREERQVGIVDGAEGQAGGRRAGPAEGDGFVFLSDHACRPREGGDPVIANVSILARAVVTGFPLSRE